MISEIIQYKRPPITPNIAPDAPALTVFGLFPSVNIIDVPAPIRPAHGKDGEENMSKYDSFPVILSKRHPMTNKINIFCKR